MLAGATHTYVSKVKAWPRFLMRSSGSVCETPVSGTIGLRNERLFAQALGDERHCELRLVLSWWSLELLYAFGV